MTILFCQNGNVHAAPQTGAVKATFLASGVCNVMLSVHQPTDASVMYACAHLAPHLDHAFVQAWWLILFACDHSLHLSMICCLYAGYAKATVHAAQRCY